MIKNKTILFAFLFFAWAIIFTHSVVPHNHHSESAEECKSHANHSSDDSVLDFVTFLSAHDHHAENPNHCHFNISSTLTNYVDSPNAYLYSENIIIPVSDQIQTIYFDHQISLLKHIYFDSFNHRGPPSFS